MAAALRARAIAVVGVERAPALQRLEQAFQVLAREACVELIGAHALGKQLADVTLVVRLHVTEALRPPAVGAGGVNVGVVIDLHEGLERDPEAAAVIEHRVMMIRNAPRTRVDVQIPVEPALLAESAEFRVFIAAAQRPAAPSRLRVEFQDLHAIPGLAQLHGRDHPRDAGAEDQHRRALRRALQIDRPAVARFLGEPQAAHGLVHRRAAGDPAHERQQVPARECMV